MSTFSPWQRRFPPATIDVAIVGGGVVGAATAFALGQQAPDARVALVEADRLASGASGRNAGFLIPGPPADYATAVERYGAETARRVLHFTLENADLIRRLGGDRFDLQQTGCLIAAGSAGEADALGRSAAVLLGEGLRCVYLDGAGVSARTGAIGYAGGLLLEAGGTLDPVKLVRELAAESGAAILEQWPVEALEPLSGGVRISGPAGRLDAGTIVLCVNAYLPRLVGESARFVRPVRAQMLATAPVDAVLDLPVYSHDGFYYVRQTRDGRLLLGGARHLFEAAEVGYDAVTTEDVQCALEAYLREHFPSVGPVAIERRWSGIMGFSPDGLPVAGELPGAAGVFIACGFTGHGMAYGVRLGRMMANLALGTGDAAADVFDPGRLGR